MTMRSAAASVLAVRCARRSCSSARSAAIYVVSQFLRNSVGVIAPDLAAELALSAAEIGLLSSAFFFAFAAAQIPLGVCARPLRSEPLHAGLRRRSPSSARCLFAVGTTPPAC